MPHREFVHNIPTGAASEFVELTCGWRNTKYVG
jgi:hypothetical protein